MHCLVLLGAVAMVTTAPVKVSERFGFDSEDATSFLQAALDSGLSEFVVDRRESPWVTRPLFIRSNQRIVFEPGVEIVAKRGEFKDVHDRLLVAKAVTNVTFVGNGATLRMWREDYANAAKYAKSEHRHLIGLHGVADVSIECLRLISSGGDGIYLGAGTDKLTPCRNVRITGCRFDDNNRQGISVISAEHLLIEDCEISNTCGVAPRDGIDFEPNRTTDRFVDCVVRNCAFFDNCGYAIEVSLQHSDGSTVPGDITIENCRSRGDRGGFKIRTRVRPPQDTKPKMRLAVRGCTIADSVFAPIWAIQNPVGAIDFSLDDCRIENPSPKLPDTPIILLDTPMPNDFAAAVPRLTNVTCDDKSARPFVFRESFLGGDTIACDYGKVEVTDAKPGEMLPAETPLIRHHARFVVYVDSPRRAILKCRRYGDLRDEMKFEIAAIDGTVVGESTLLGAREAAIEFTAPARGFYTLESFYPRGMLRLVAANVPVGLDCAGAIMPQRKWGYEECAANFAESEGVLYLPLPADKACDLWFSGAFPDERTRVKVTNTAGEEVFASDALVYWTRCGISPQAREDMLSIEFGKPSRGRHEDFRFGIGGVPPIVFPNGARFWR